MAVEVVWLDQAKDDLREILDFIAKDNAFAALTYVDGIERACSKLADFPDAGQFTTADFVGYLSQSSHLLQPRHETPNRFDRSSHRRAQRHEAFVS